MEVIFHGRISFHF
nr:unnamed protein product [Callosobruchus analis]CAI5841581.1 unnamed protein product [Callosobruchus analis]